MANFHDFTTFSQFLGILVNLNMKNSLNQSYSENMAKNIKNMNTPGGKSLCLHPRGLKRLNFDQKIAEISVLCHFGPFEYTNINKKHLRQSVTL